MGRNFSRYEHTQIGYLMLFVFLAVTALFGYILAQEVPNPAIIAIMVFILIIISSFSTLKVVIDENYLRIKFGYGIFRKSFLLTEITSAKAAKNHWYYGWGIRMWLWPYMWIFNVSGFDAVEITSKNGNIYRIGTDESKKLEQAISQLIKL